MPTRRARVEAMRVRVDTVEGRRVQCCGSMPHERPVRAGLRHAARCCALACCAALMAGGATALRAAGGAAHEVRALWVTRSSLTSADAIEAMVRSAASSGFNTLLVQVRGRGDAFYASRFEPRAEALAGAPAAFDPLALVIARAHARGIRVHAWVNVDVASSGTLLPTARTHLVYAHPEWLMVPKPLAFELARIDPKSPEYLGRLARWTHAQSDLIEGIYLSPIHPGAVAHLAAVVDDLVSQYDLDGVHLDYVRYPSSEFDYSRGALTAFRDAIAGELTPEERARYGARDITDLVGLTEVRAAEWADFRRSRLNTLVMRLRTAVKTRKPGVVLSAAVYPDPAEANGVRLQDWRMWLDNRLIDVVCPMAYTPDATIFASQIASVRRLATGSPVWAGIGAYRLSTAQTVENIETARRLGADGIVLFSYDSLTRPGTGLDYLSSVARAAFVAP
jgi:uncharacterized lipoprotein YddW (UPF0748 family)